MIGVDLLVREPASQRIVEGALGSENGRGFDTMKISLEESHVAWASYEGPLS